MPSRSQGLPPGELPFESHSSQWELPRLWARLAADGVKVERLWSDIHRLVALTLAAMQPTIAHAYSTAFSVNWKPPAARRSAVAPKPLSRRPSSDTAGVPAAAEAAEGGKVAPLVDENERQLSRGAGGGVGKLSGRTGRDDAAAASDKAAGTTSDAAGGTASDRQASASEARPEVRRCFQILGFDVMLDSAFKPWLLEVNHSPSMALAGNEPEEVDAKCSVVTAALRLGLADDHTPSLCERCEVRPLHGIAWPLCALEPVRKLFEAIATSRSSQQWTINVSGFEKLVSPCLAQIFQAPLEEGEGEVDVSGAPAVAAAATAPPQIDLRQLFADACAARADVGSGWDVPAAGQMTLWGFTEALLRLAECAQKASNASDVHVGAGGLAGTLDHVVRCLAAVVA